MRTSKILDALFPEVRTHILAATLNQPEKIWFLSELAAYLQTQPSSLQREISALANAGILRQWRDGRRLYFKAEAMSPVFSELKGLFEKTIGIVPFLQKELESHADTVRVAFVYGSIARSEEHSESDIDLLVIGSLGLADLLPALRSAEHRLGRAVNPSVYSVDEFQSNARKHEHYLTAVLEGKKEFLKGNQHELEAILGKG